MTVLTDVEISRALNALSATAGELLGREDGRLIAEVRMQDGRWVVERKLRAVRP